MTRPPRTSETEADYGGVEAGLLSSKREGELLYIISRGGSGCGVTEYTRVHCTVRGR